MFDVVPIANGEHLETIASGLEIKVLMEGSLRWDDLEWDRDLLIEWYNSVYAPNQGLEPFPAQEGQMTFDEAKTAIQSELRSILERRARLLATAYPFLRDEENGIILARKNLEDCTPQMAAYLWLSLFEALHSEHVAIDVQPELLAASRSTFEAIFEVVVCFAMLGKADGPIWYLGNVRGIHKLLKALKHMCRRMGSGVVLQHDQLTEAQVVSNDGGVDVVLVERDQDSMMYLVGATIQKKNRRKKVIGTDEVARFRGFFLHQIRATTQGVMAVPFRYSELDAELCLERNCQYFHIDVLRDRLGRSAIKDLRELRHASLALRDRTKHFAVANDLSEPLQEAGCQAIG